MAIRLRRTIAFGIVVGMLFATSGVILPAAAAEGKQATKLGLGGYCPVCLLKAKKWVAGSPEHRVEFDGFVYQFPSEKEAAMFRADPARYVPALGGDCIVCYVMTGKRIPGNVQHAVTYRGRIYLFPGEKEKRYFMNNPEKYADADLALGGNCPVCKVMAGKDVPGKPEFTVIYHGLRYQFPSDKERRMFLSNPDKFARARSAQAKPSARDTVTVVGRTGCAACEFGVKPIKARDTLGLAVVTDDGKIYVIEDAHRLYPNIYDTRFDGLKVVVTGKVIQRKGKFAWLEPVSLRVQ